MEVGGGRRGSAESDLDRTGMPECLRLSAGSLFLARPLTSATRKGDARAVCRAGWGMVWDGLLRVVAAATCSASDLVTLPRELRPAFPCGSAPDPLPAVLPPPAAGSHAPVVAGKHTS